MVVVGVEGVGFGVAEREEVRLRGDWPKMDTAKVRVSRDMIILLGFILVLLSLIRKWRDIILSQLRLHWVPLAVIAVPTLAAHSPLVS